LYVYIRTGVLKDCRVVGKCDFPFYGSPFVWSYL